MQRPRILATFVGTFELSRCTLLTATFPVVTHILFETGSKDLKLMEQKVYIGSGRFIVEAGKPTIVEYKISEVVAS